MNDDMKVFNDTGKRFGYDCRIMESGSDRMIVDDKGEIVCFYEVDDYSGEVKVKEVDETIRLDDTKMIQLTYYTI